MILNAWLEDLKDVPVPSPSWPTAACLQLKTGLSSEETSVVLPSDREEVLCTIHGGHQDITKFQILAWNCMFRLWTSNDLLRSEICQCHWPQQTTTYYSQHKHWNAHSKPCSWSVSLMSINGWSPVTSIQRCLLNIRYPSQCTSANVLWILKELSIEFGIPELVKINGGPKIKSTLFMDFADAWKFDHLIKVPHNPCANGFTKSMVKVIKCLLTCTKYSRKDP